jgi:hypothetical protein
MTTGHADALNVYTNINLERVNDEQLAIGFECLETKSNAT